MATPIVHHPLVFALGPVEVTGFGLAVLLAFAIAQLITARELARRGHDARPVGDLLTAALIGTLVGAKLYYVAVITHDWRDLFSRGGFVYWGGFIGAVIAVSLVVRRQRLAFFQIADVAGIAIAAGYAVGRTGCWAVGDDYGKPWDGPLAVAFPEGAPPSTVANLRDVFHAAVPAGMPPDAVLAVYPTQLLEVVLGSAMFALLWKWRDHRHAAGWLFGLYGVLAGLERFAVEFFRAKDDRFLVGGLSMAQAIAIVVGLVGAAWMAWRWHAGPGAPGIYQTGADRRAEPHLSTR